MESLQLELKSKLFGLKNLECLDSVQTQIGSLAMIIFKHIDTEVTEKTTLTLLVASQNYRFHTERSLEVTNLKVSEGDNFKRGVVIYEPNGTPMMSPCTFSK